MTKDEYLASLSLDELRRLRKDIIDRVGYDGYFQVPITPLYDMELFDADPDAPIDPREIEVKVIDVCVDDIEKLFRYKLKTEVLEVGKDGDRYPTIEDVLESDYLRESEYAFGRVIKAKRRPWVVGFNVNSGSETYKVSIDANGKCGCTCSAWKFAKRPKPDCKHIEAFKANVTQRAKVIDYFKKYPRNTPTLYETWGWLTEGIADFLDPPIKAPSKPKGKDFLTELKENARWSF